MNFTCRKQKMYLLIISKNYKTKLQIFHKLFHSPKTVFTPKANLKYPYNWLKPTAICHVPYCSPNSSSTVTIRMFTKCIEPWGKKMHHLTHTHCPFWTQKLPCFCPHSVEQSAWQFEERRHLTETVQAIAENCLVWARILVGGTCEKSDFNRRRINVQFDWLIFIIFRAQIHKRIPKSLA